jgi:hypothetical protein
MIEKGVFAAPSSAMRSSTRTANLLMRHTHGCPTAASTMETMVNLKPRNATIRRGCGAGPARQERAGKAQSRRWYSGRQASPYFSIPTRSGRPFETYSPKTCTRYVLARGPSYSMK